MTSRQRLIQSSLIALTFFTASGCALLQRLRGSGEPLQIAAGTPMLQFKTAGLYVHTEPGNARIWRVRGSGPAGEEHRYSGRVRTTDGQLEGLSVSDVAQKGGKVSLDNNLIEFDFSSRGGISGNAAGGFKWENQAGSCHQFELFIDGRPARRDEIKVGFDDNIRPASSVFTACRKG